MSNKHTCCFCQSLTTMKVLYKDDPRVLVIYSETHSLTFQFLERKNADPTVAVEVLPNEKITKEQGFRHLIKRPVFGCLGLIRIENQIFLSVITGAQKDVAHPMPYELVDKIYNVEFLSLNSDEWDFVDLDSTGMPTIDPEQPNQYENDYPRAVHPCFELKKLLSNGSFYFSNDFDLTSLLQDRGISKKRMFETMEEKEIHKTFGENYKQDYMWNSFLMQELLSFRSNLSEYAQSILDSNQFLTIAIRGFAKTVQVNGQGDTISIVSKQSWRRAGTRFNARGIDDDGYVANFVESEFVYCNLSKSSVFAFAQIRGSVPTFWEQDSTLINPKITLTRSIEATQPIFNKHFGKICHQYGVCHNVNLLSKTKPAEVQVLRRYKDLYNRCDLRDEMSFTEFDFHAETKQLSGGFAGATKILPYLHDSLEQFGWLSYDIEQGDIVTRQDGVFRTNCLDCLDRTNLIQQVICQYVLDHAMSSFSLGDSYRERIAHEDLVSKHNSLWADNGDAISQIYTGTNALKSSFSRSGKMNFAGALSDVTKSVSRMYQNTFVDGRKQSTMDLLVGYDARNSIPVRIYDPINEYVTDKLKANSELFTSKSDIFLYIGTFNVSAHDPSLRVTDLTTWLFPVENSHLPLPDVYAIGLQEIVELNAGSILGGDNNKASKWARLISEQLNTQNEQYVLLRTESIVSMTLLLFVKKSQLKHVTQVSGSSKKTGMGGITANKGGCAVRFNFGSTSFAMVTSHLAAGTQAVIERFNDYQTIMQGLTFTRNATISDHDHILWFGDLNYRISLPNEQCRSLIENGAFDDLIGLDQLNNEMANKGAFYGFKEGAIKFYPTYKFDKGTSDYDSSEKQRVPSWTDRVLYKSARGIDPLKNVNYSSLMNICLSDHKPVFSTFNCVVLFVDEAKKVKLAKQLYENYKLGNKNVAINNLDQLIEFSTSSGSSGSRSSKSSPASTFSSDTLSEMNLMDSDYDVKPKAPKLPGRPNLDNSLPRRIPPPPMSRKAVPSEKKLETSSSNTPPPPPPRRTASTILSVPIGFSSTPLIPSRSNSATPSKGNSPTSTPHPQSSRVSSPATLSKPQESKSLLSAESSSSSGPIKPMIPTKPAALSGNKTGQEVNDSTSMGSQSGVSNVSRTMSEWKPLVPK